MRLAQQIKDSANNLPSSHPKRFLIINEADRVFRTSDLDVMIEALTRALKDLSIASAS